MYYFVTNKNSRNQLHQAIFLLVTLVLFFFCETQSIFGWSGLFKPTSSPSFPPGTVDQVITQKLSPA